MKKISLRRLKELAADCGLQNVSSTDCNDLDIDYQRLSDWQAQGYAGEMNYMLRDPGLLASPRRLVPEGKTLISVALPYSQNPHPPRKAGYGRVARYAWGRDYHKVLPRLLKLLVQKVQLELKIEINARVFSDAVPLLERAAAKKAALGFIGNNSLLIIPRLGSFTNLGEIVWDVEVDDEVSQTDKGGCGSCVRCMRECPTTALRAPRVLDASRCISYLTIEKRGALTNTEGPMLGEWVFGCDICQDTCPFNHRALAGLVAAGHPHLTAAAGAGPLLSLSEILKIRTTEKFVERFQGTPLMRAKREGLLRNACVVAANMFEYDLQGDLVECANHDPSDMVRAHAQASLKALFENDTVVRNI